MCVNDIGMHWPGRLTHWYSNNVDKLLKWSEARRNLYIKLFGTGWTLHSCTRREQNVNVKHWDIPGQGGSGLRAIQVACLMGYTNITVAGMPFDDNGHYYDPPETHNLRKDRRWSHFTNETPDKIIEELVPLFKGRVRAISGRLCEYLG